MKQNITQYQWDDISNNTKEHFRRDIGEWTGLGPFLPTIGQMIEFLGDKLCRMTHEIYNEDEYKLQQEVFNMKWTWIVIMYDRTFLHEELCDALWDAVKNKLKQ